MPIDAKLVQTMAASAKLHVQELEDHGKAVVAGAVADAKHIVGHAKEAISDLTSAVMHATQEGAKDAKQETGVVLDTKTAPKQDGVIISEAPKSGASIILEDGKKPQPAPVASAPQAPRAWLIPAIIAGGLAVTAVAHYALRLF